MTKYVLIGQKRDTDGPREDIVLGYYNDTTALQEDKEYFSREYCRFFIGRESKLPTLPPVTDAALFKLLQQAGTDAAV